VEVVREVRPGFIIIIILLLLLLIIIISISISIINTTTSTTPPSSPPTPCPPQQPTNAYDPNALLVRYTANGGMTTLGYLPARIAKASR
jgi:hypothetical protein